MSEPANGDEPTTPLAARWSGSAAVPEQVRTQLPARTATTGDTSPLPLPPRDPTLELPLAERAALESAPPVDPWAAAAPAVEPPYPPGAIPAPAGRPMPAAPPHRPMPAGPPRGPVAAGPALPPGYVLVAMRRRRRWPWVMLALTLLAVACCCGVPTYFAKPVWEQYPATASLPARLADLRLSDDSRHQQLAQRLNRETRAAHLFAEDVFAGVYIAPKAKQVTIFGTTGFRFSPEKDLDAEIARLTPGYRLTSLQSIDSGVRGEYQRCGTGWISDTSVVLCTWADHGSLGNALFTRLSVADSADLLSRLRKEIITRG